mgnify:FL=1
MKKLYSVFAAGVLALLALSCVKEEHAVFDASKATAPVLVSYEQGEDAITASYTPGVFKQGFNEKMAPYHSLALVSLDGQKVSKTLTTSDKEGVLTLKNTTLAKALISLGKAEGSTASVELAVRASAQEPSKDNGRNGYVDSDGHISIASFEVVIPEVVGSPYAEYTESSTWSVIGSLSAYEIGWDGDLNMWTDGNNHVAAHVKLAAGDEFKFRQGQSWDVNMGGDFGGLDNEFSVTQDGPNIKVGADGIYDLYLNPTDGIAWITAAYDPLPDYAESSNWSVIGALSLAGINWNGDIAMITNGTWHVALGVDLAADDEFKFRQDASWDVNLGGDFGGMDTEFAVTQDGPNIKVGADGCFDLYVNPSDGIAKVTEASGAKVSAKIGGDEPDSGKPAVWSLIGTIGGTSWDTDTDMQNTTGDIWVARLVTLTADDEFKIRADHSWDENYGGPEANDHSTIDPSNPYDVYKPELGVAFAAGDKNIHVGVAGTYDVTFDYANKTIQIDSHVAAYSLIGEINGDSWTKDVVMSEKDGVWTSPVVEISGGFKIRFDFSWDDANTYGAADGFTPTVGEPFTAAQPGGNISVEPGQYKVQFTPATKEVIIQAVNYPEHLYMIGAEFGGWDWNSDGVVEMTPVLHNPDWGAEAEGQFYTVRYFSAGQGFKFCAQRAWSGDFWGLTTNDGFTEDGGNCTVAEDGVYLVHIDLKNEKVHVEPARVFGIGDAFGGWNEEMADAQFVADGKTLKATVPAGANLRMYVASSIATSGWWTREFNIFDGQIVPRLMDELAAVPVQAGQVVTLDFNAGTGSITGEGEAPALPQTMYIIGDGVGGWDWAADYIVDMTPVNGKLGQFWAIRNIEAGKGFKFCSVKEWKGDFTGLGEDTGYTVDGGNCYVAETGVYMIYVDVENKKVCVEPAKVYGIGDCFGGWSVEMSGALFANADGKVSITVPSAGELRMYAASSIATSDWWTREFIILDGQIVYRGNGGDQERVSVAAGAKVTLDFNAGTGVIE